MGSLQTPREIVISEITLKKITVCTIQMEDAAEVTNGRL